MYYEGNADLCVEQIIAGVYVPINNFSDAALPQLIDTVNLTSVKHQTSLTQNSPLSKEDQLKAEI